MKKVSVFTVLTCFLAGAAHFPCYAGNIFGKSEDPVDDGRSKGLPAQSKPGEQLPNRGSIPSSHPKPTPSSSRFDPVITDVGGLPHPDSDDLDPALLAGMPDDFLAASERESERRSQQSVEKDKEVDQVLKSIRNAVGDVPGLTIHVHMAPPPQQLPPSATPSKPTPPIVPMPVLQSSNSHEFSVDRTSLPAQQLSQIPSMHPTPYPPHGDSQPPLSIPSSSRDHEEVCQVTRPVSGWALTLPTTLKPMQIPNTRGQLVRLPKVLDLCIYAALSDVTHPDFKVINSQKVLLDSQKPAGFNLINTYLESYGNKFGQDVTAIANCLKQAVESSNGRPVSFKICQNKTTRTALFMLHVEGGAVIIGKVPGQDI